MQPESLNAAHRLYAQYQTLPDEAQQAFLQELVQHQYEKVEELAFDFACRLTKDTDEFLSEEESAAFLASLPR